VITSAGKGAGIPSHPAKWRRPHHEPPSRTVLPARAEAGVGIKSSEAREGITDVEPCFGAPSRAARDGVTEAAVAGPARVRPAEAVEGQAMPGRRQETRHVILEIETMRPGSPRARIAPRRLPSRLTAKSSIQLSARMRWALAAGARVAATSAAIRMGTVRTFGTSGLCCVSS
jgi:hypothetical protein